MYIVWRGRSWGQYRMDEGWRDYEECQSSEYRGRAYDNNCHRNHVHLSLNPTGATKSTSWWTGVPLPTPPPTPPSAEVSTAGQRDFDGGRLRNG